ncbi:MAG: DUF1289 domain-containing protein [Gammaproteobacteria bacterium]|nr:DUF1289 domain-containing protein [Gammaproteobacteria bacterium]
MQEQPVKSPCIDVCRLDEATGYCLGCHRSGEEIQRWPYLDNDQRRALLLTLQQRAAEQKPGRD